MNLKNLEVLVKEAIMWELAMQAMFLYLRTKLALEHETQTIGELARAFQGETPKTVGFSTVIDFPNCRSGYITASLGSSVRLGLVGPKQSKADGSLPTAAPRVL